MPLPAAGVYKPGPHSVCKYFSPLPNHFLRWAGHAVLSSSGTFSLACHPGSGAEGISWVLSADTVEMSSRDPSTSL